MNCVDCGKQIFREKGHSSRCSHCEYLHRKNYHELYRKSEKRKISVKNDNDSEPARARKRVYNKSSKGIAAVHKYHRTPKGQESMKKQVFKRRARLKGGITNLPAGWKKKLLSDYSNCAYCSSSSELQIEHLYPVQGEAGVENVYNNLVMACRKCNQSKGNKLLEKWFEKNPARKRQFYANGKNIEKLNYLAHFYNRKKINPYIENEKIVL